MRTVFVKVSGEPKPGDFVAVQATNKYQGGASTIYHKVSKPRDEIIYLDTIEIEDPDTGELIATEDINGRKEIRTHHETPETIVDALISAASSANGAFDPVHYQAKKRNGREFIIQVSDTMNDN